MTRQDAVKEAVTKVLDTGFTFVVLRRGREYKSQMIAWSTPRGWKVAEQIGTGNVHNFVEVAV